MQAAILYKGEKHLRVEDVDVRKPGPKEARVKVECCGVCGSDIHITVHPTMKLKQYPRILGHESSGVVLELGDDVKNVQVGDRVVIGAGTSCGTCPNCLKGQWNACESVGVLGFEEDGAFAEEVVVPGETLVKLPDEIPFDQGAILADAVSTPFHALKYQGRLTEGETLAVFGCGGLGIHAVAIGKALGASKVVALDVDDGALRNAVEFGADETINVSSVRNAGKALKEITKGVDVVADFSGYYKNIEDSMRAMNKYGRMVMVGLGRSQLKVSVPAMVIERQLCLCGSFGCDKRAIPELIDLLSSGKLDLSKSITSHHPLGEVNDCLEDLYHRRGNPIRYIIKPNG